MKTINHTIELPFPIMAYSVMAKYAEIKRASGVSYILMALIDNGEQIGESIADLLSSFDISIDLHGIFAQELCDLVQNKIISMKKGVYNSDDILNWPASNFGFTPQGRQMYENGNYLTGETNQKKAKITFNPVTKEYSNYGVQVSKLPEEQKAIVFEKWAQYLHSGINGLDEWVKSHQGKIGIKNGAQITDIEYVEDEFSVMKLKSDSSAHISVSDDTSCTTITMEDEEQQELFENYYDSFVLNELIRSKYGRLRNKTGEEIKLNASSKTDNIVGFFLPNEIQYAFRNPSCSYAMNKENVIPKIDNKKISISIEDSQKAIGLFDEQCEAILFNKYSAKAYSPVLLTNEYGLELSVLAEIEIENEDYQKLLEVFYNVLCEKNFNDIALEQLCFIQEASNSNNNYLIDFTNKYISTLNTDKDIVDILLQLFPFFSTNEDWKTYCISVMSNNYVKSLDNLDIRDIQYFHVVYKNSVQYLFQDEQEYFTDIIRRLLQENSANRTLDALSKIGCKPDDYLSQLNVISSYMRSVIENVEIIDSNSLAKEFDGFRISFNDLKVLLDIDSPVEGSEESGFDIEKFFKLFSAVTKYYSQLRKYSHLAEEEYKIIENYIPAFEQFNETASIRKIADNSPEKLSIAEIEKLINSGEYNRVIEILYYKIQLYLSNALGKSGHLGSMIATAYSKNIITLNDRNELNAFKDARNPLQHPNLPKVSFDANNLKVWMNLICNMH